MCKSSRELIDPWERKRKKLDQCGEYPNIPKCGYDELYNRPPSNNQTPSSGAGCIDYQEIDSKLQPWYFKDYENYQKRYNTERKYESTTTAKPSIDENLLSALEYVYNYAKDNDSQNLPTDAIALYEKYLTATDKTRFSDIDIDRARRDYDDWYNSLPEIYKTNVPKLSGTLDTKADNIVDEKKGRWIKETEQSKAIEILKMIGYSDDTIKNVLSYIPPKNLYRTLSQKTMAENIAIRKVLELPFGDVEQMHKIAKDLRKVAQFYNSTVENGTQLSNLDFPSTSTIILSSNQDIEEANVTPHIYNVLDPITVYGIVTEENPEANVTEMTYDEVNQTIVDAVDHKNSRVQHWVNTFVTRSAYYMASNFQSSLDDKMARHDLEIAGGSRSASFMGWDLDKRLSSYFALDTDYSKMKEDPFALIKGIVGMTYTLFSAYSQARRDADFAFILDGYQNYQITSTGINKQLFGEYEVVNEEGIDKVKMVKSGWVTQSNREQFSKYYDENGNLTEYTKELLDTMILTPEQLALENTELWTHTYGDDFSKYETNKIQKNAYGETVTTSPESYANAGLRGFDIGGFYYVYKWATGQNYTGFPETYSPLDYAGLIIDIVGAVDDGMDLIAILKVVDSVNVKQVAKMTEAVENIDNTKPVITSTIDTTTEAGNVFGPTFKGVMHPEMKPSWDYVTNKAEIKPTPYIQTKSNIETATSLNDCKMTVKGNDIVERGDGLFVPPKDDFIPQDKFAYGGIDNLDTDYFTVPKVNKVPNITKGQFMVMTDIEKYELRQTLKQLKTGEGLYEIEHSNKVLVDFYGGIRKNPLTEEIIETTKNIGDSTIIKDIVLDPNNKSFSEAEDFVVGIANAQGFSADTTKQIIINCLEMENEGTLKIPTMYDAGRYAEDTEPNLFANIDIPTMGSLTRYPADKLSKTPGRITGIKPTDRDIPTALPDGIINPFSSANVKSNNFEETLDSPGWERKSSIPTYKSMMCAEANDLPAEETAIINKQQGSTSSYEPLTSTYDFSSPAYWKNRDAVSKSIIEYYKKIGKPYSKETTSGTFQTTLGMPSKTNTDAEMFTQANVLNADYPESMVGNPNFTSNATNYALMQSRKKEHFGIILAKEGVLDRIRGYLANMTAQQKVAFFTTSDGTQIRKTENIDKIIFGNPQKQFNEDITEVSKTDDLYNKEFNIQDDYADIVDNAQTVTVTTNYEFEDISKTLGGHVHGTYVSIDGKLVDISGAEVELTVSQLEGIMKGATYVNNLRQQQKYSLRLDGSISKFDENVRINRVKGLFLNTLYKLGNKDYASGLNAYKNYETAARFYEMPILSFDGIKKFMWNKNTTDYLKPLFKEASLQTYSTYGMKQYVNKVYCISKDKKTGKVLFEGFLENDEQLNSIKSQRGISNKFYLRSEEIPLEEAIELKKLNTAGRIKSILYSANNIDGFIHNGKPISVSGKRALNVIMDGSFDDKAIRASLTQICSEMGIPFSKIEDQYKNIGKGLDEKGTFTFKITAKDKSVRTVTFQTMDNLVAANKNNPKYEAWWSTPGAEPSRINYNLWNAKTNNVVVVLTNCKSGFNIDTQALYVFEAGASFENPVLIYGFKDGTGSPIFTKQNVFANSNGYYNAPVQSAIATMSLTDDYFAEIKTVTVRDGWSISYTNRIKPTEVEVWTKMIDGKEQVVYVTRENMKASDYTKLQDRLVYDGWDIKYNSKYTDEMEMDFLYKQIGGEIYIPESGTGAVGDWVTNYYSWLDTALPEGKNILTDKNITIVGNSNGAKIYQTALFDIYSNAKSSTVTRLDDMSADEIFSSGGKIIYIGTSDSFKQSSLLKNLTNDQLMSVVVNPDEYTIRAMTGDGSRIIYIVDEIPTDYDATGILALSHYDIIPTGTDIEKSLPSDTPSRVILDLRNKIDTFNTTGTTNQRIIKRSIPTSKSNIQIIETTGEQIYLAEKVVKDSVVKLVDAKGNSVFIKVSNVVKENDLFKVSYNLVKKESVIDKTITNPKVAAMLPIALLPALDRYDEDGLNYMPDDTTFDVNTFLYDYYINQSVPYYQVLSMYSQDPQTKEYVKIEGNYSEYDDEYNLYSKQQVYQGAGIGKADWLFKGTRKVADYLWAVKALKKEEVFELGIKMFSKSESSSVDSAFDATFKQLIASLNKDAITELSNMNNTKRLNEYKNIIKNQYDLGTGNTYTEVEKIMKDKKITKLEAINELAEQQLVKSYGSVYIAWQLNQKGIGTLGKGSRSLKEKIFTFRTTNTVIDVINSTNNNADMDLFFKEFGYRPQLISKDDARAMLKRSATDYTRYLEDATSTNSLSRSGWLEEYTNIISKTDYVSGFQKTLIQRKLYGYTLPKTIGGGTGIAIGGGLVAYDSIKSQGMIGWLNSDNNQFAAYNPAIQDILKSFPDESHYMNFVQKNKSGPSLKLTPELANLYDDVWLPKSFYSRDFKDKFTQAINKKRYGQNIMDMFIGHYIIATQTSWLYFMEIPGYTMSWKDFNEGMAGWEARETEAFEKYSLDKEKYTITNTVEGSVKGTIGAVSYLPYATLAQNINNYRALDYEFFFALNTVLNKTYDNIKETIDNYPMPDGSKLSDPKNKDLYNYTMSKLDSDTLSVYSNFSEVADFNPFSFGPDMYRANSLVSLDDLEIMRNNAVEIWGKDSPQAKVYQDLYDDQIIGVWDFKGGGVKQYIIDKSKEYKIDKGSIWMATPQMYNFYMDNPNLMDNPRYIMAISKSENFSPSGLIMTLSDTKVTEHFGTRKVNEIYPFVTTEQIDSLNKEWMADPDMILTEQNDAIQTTIINTIQQNPNYYIIDFNSIKTEDASVSTAIADKDIPKTPVVVSKELESFLKEDKEGNKYYDIYGSKYIIFDTNIPNPNNWTREQVEANVRAWAEEQLNIAREKDPNATIDEEQLKKIIEDNVFVWQEQCKQYDEYMKYATDFNIESTKAAKLMLEGKIEVSRALIEEIETNIKTRDPNFSFQNLILEMCMYDMIFPRYARDDKGNIIKNNGLPVLVELGKGLPTETSDLLIIGNTVTPIKIEDVTPLMIHNQAINIFVKTYSHVVPEGTIMDYNDVTKVFPLIEKDWVKAYFYINPYGMGGIYPELAIGPGMPKVWDEENQRWRQGSHIIMKDKVFLEFGFTAPINSWTTNWIMTDLGYGNIQPLPFLSTQDQIHYRDLFLENFDIRTFAIQKYSNGQDKEGNPLFPYGYDMSFVMNLVEDTNIRTPTFASYGMKDYEGNINPVMQVYTFTDIQGHQTQSINRAPMYFKGSHQVYQPRCSETYFQEAPHDKYGRTLTWINVEGHDVLACSDGDIVTISGGQATNPYTPSFEQNLPKTPKYADSP